MSDSIETWLKTEAGINFKIHSYENDFANGYYFGEIFYTYGLNHKFVENFQNKVQWPYILRNYHFLPTLFKNIKVDFNEDIQNSLQKKELGVAKQLLFKMKDAISTMGLTPAPFEKRVGMERGEFAIIDRCQKKGTAGKSIFVEKKMVKFENEFIKQKEEMIMKKKMDDDKYSQIIQSKRNDHLNKMRSNHQYIKEWDLQSKKRWRKTVNDRREVTTWHSNLDNFLTNRIHAKEELTKTMARSEVYDGISGFEDNALRLGVELFKNPNEPRISVKLPFNPVASMQKIKTKITGLEIARYEKEKRQRKLAVQQRKDQEIYTEIKQEKEMLEKFKGISDKTQKSCHSDFIKDLKKDLILENRKDTVVQNKQASKIYSATFVERQLQTTSKDKYLANKKEKELLLRERQIQERIEKYQKHYGVCYNAIQYMVDMSEVCFDQMGEDIETQLTTGFWRELTNKFISFEDLINEKDILTIRKQNTIGKYSIIDSSTKLEKNFLKFMRCSRVSVTQFTYDFFLQGDNFVMTTYNQDTPDFRSANPFQSQTIKEILDMAYPIKPKNQMPIRIITSLPLKINLIGKDFSGKRTVANKLKQYIPSLHILVFEDIMKEVIDMCKQDESNLDASRVRARAKAKTRTTKKMSKVLVVPDVEEDENVDSSQQVMEFKEVGEKIVLMKEENTELTDEIMIELIIKKLGCLFPNSSKKKCTSRYFELKDETEKRIEDEEKAKENVNAAPVKDDKKAKGKDKKDTKKEDEEMEEEIKKQFDHNEYFYTEGFVQIGFPNTPQQARMLDKMMTGFEPQKDRLNNEAEEKKETSRRVLDIPGWESEVNALGSFDLVCVIDSDNDLCMHKAKDRKLDPSTGEIYTSKNPPPEHDKKLTDRLETIQVDEEDLNGKFQKFSNNVDELSLWYNQFSVSDENKKLTPIKPLTKFKVEEETNTKEDIVMPLTIKIKEVQHTKYENYLYYNENQDLLSSKIDHSGFNTLNIQEKGMARTNSTIKQNEVPNDQFTDSPNAISVNVNGDTNDEIKEGKKNENLDVLVKQHSIEDDFIKATPSKHSTMRNQQSFDIGRHSRGQYFSMGSVMQAGHQAKCLEKSIDCLDKFMFDYLTNTDKDINLFDTNITGFKANLIEMQRRFTKHFQRNEKTDDLLRRFVENYNRFAQENTQMLERDYTVDSLIKKAEEVHDSIWEVIQGQKNDALKDKEQITSSNYINKEIDKMFKVFLSCTVSEINKIFYTKLFLMYHCHLKHPDVANELNYDIKPVELKESNMPPINPEEYIPFKRIAFIFDHIKEFYEEHRSHLKDIDDPIVKKYAESQLIQITKSENRQNALKGWFILKLKKSKLRYTLFLHRIEDWIVNSIKAENSIIYDTISDIINNIRAQQTFLTYKKKVFDPVIKHKIIDFRGISNILAIPLKEQHGDNFFSYSQVYMILIDIRNLDLDIVFEYPFDTVLNHLVFRIKHNHIGLVKMFPESWEGLKPHSLENILKKLIRGHDDDLKIRWFDFSQMILLWKYPLPTLKQLNEYEVKFKTENVKSMTMEENVNDQLTLSGISFHEFIKIPCWLDVWDEGQCKNMTKDSLYQTGFTKSFLYWVFKSQNQQFDQQNYFDTLKRYVTKYPESELYRDYFTKKQTVDSNINSLE